MQYLGAERLCGPRLRSYRLAQHFFDCESSSFATRRTLLGTGKASADVIVRFCSCLSKKTMQ